MMIMRISMIILITGIAMPDGHQPQGMQRQHGCVFRNAPNPPLAYTVWSATASTWRNIGPTISSNSSRQHSCAYDGGRSTRKGGTVSREIKRAFFRVGDRNRILFGEIFFPRV